MRVTGVSSFYNASSISRLSKVESVNDKATPDSSLPSSSLNVEDAKIIYSGVKQTRVSSDNSYQKQMLEDKEFAMMRMAGKLFDKLPSIMSDIANVKDTVTESAKETNNSRIIINENSNFNYGGNIKPELENIEL